MPSSKMTALLDDLDATLNDFNVENRSRRPTHYGPPPVRSIPVPSRNSSASASQEGGGRLIQGNPYAGLYSQQRSSEDLEVARLREQLEFAKMELERREYHNHLILQQHHQFARNHMPQPHVESAYYNRSPVQPSVSGRSTISSSPSLASVAQTDTNSWIGSTASNARNARPVTKSPTGWSGRASQRFTNPISDAIIDDACNLDLHPRVPVDVVIRVVGMIKAFYEAPKNKGAGASQAIMAVMYVSNLEDPAYVRRSMEVLDILYKYGGPIFAQNLSLNLDFYQHFLETRKHRNQEEKENISFLCSLFAGWYLLVPSFEDLAQAGNMADPTPRVKQFFEGLLRANYPFPIGSLNHIPADKMASITAWSLLRGGAFSFSTYKH